MFVPAIFTASPTWSTAGPWWAPAARDVPSHAAAPQAARTTVIRAMRGTMVTSSLRALGHRAWRRPTRNRIPRTTAFTTASAATTIPLIIDHGAFVTAAPSTPPTRGKTGNGGSEPPGGSPDGRPPFVVVVVELAPLAPPAPPLESG